MNLEHLPQGNTKEKPPEAENFQKVNISLGKHKGKTAGGGKIQNFEHFP